MAFIGLLIGVPALVRNRSQAIITERLPEKDAFNFLSFHALDDAQKIAMELQAFSMFASDRIVLVHSMELATVDFLDFLLDYVSSPNPSVIVLLTGNAMPKKGPIRKLKAAIQKQGLVEEFRLKNVNVASYLNSLCKKHQLTLSGRARMLLLQKVGKDLLSLENEVEKLRCYVGEAGSISDRDVEEIVSTISEASIWDLTDAVVSKDASKAMKTLHRMLEEGRAPHQIFSTICWQVRRLLELQEYIRTGSSYPKSWSRTPERKKREAMSMLKRYPLRPSSIISSLQDTNRLFNSSKAGDRRNLELLILRLCFP
ncbi:MAG: DNA polymerase III subunit delta [Myxococcota bacterium]|nr:DNA polymerase III subunit delta [Myxococcota bacterium]